METVIRLFARYSNPFGLHLDYFIEKFKKLYSLFKISIFLKVLEFRARLLIFESNFFHKLEFRVESNFISSTRTRLEFRTVRTFLVKSLNLTFIG